MKLVTLCEFTYLPMLSWIEGFKTMLTVSTAPQNDHNPRPRSSVDQNQDPNRSTPSHTPSFSLSSIPSWAIGAIYNRCCSQETTPPQPKTTTSHVHSNSEDIPEYLGDMLSDSPVTNGGGNGNDGQSPSSKMNRSGGSTRGRPSAKSSSKPKTSYQLAHPPWHQFHKRLRIRPRVLLQLQQTSQTPRPIPMLDVMPASSLAGRPVIGRRLPSVIKTKDGLGLNDLIVARSELFDKTVSGILDKNLGLSASEGEEEEDENASSREVVATICRIYREGYKGKAEIRLVNGPVWEATPLENGSYEFTANTPNGVQIVRWVPRAAKSNRFAFAQDGEGQRFTFSVIDPTTRRHPVIASMTQRSVEVFDRYTKTTGHNNTFFSTHRPSLSGDSDASNADLPMDPSVQETDDDLRTLIILTGIWVAFKEGWSQIFNYDDNSQCVSRSSSTSRKNNNNNTSTTAEGEDKEQIAPSPIGGGGQDQKGDINKPRKYGSLTRRSNSTGSALKERKARSFSAPMMDQTTTTTTTSTTTTTTPRRKRHSTLSVLNSRPKMDEMMIPYDYQNANTTNPSPPPQPRARLAKVDLDPSSVKLNGWKHPRRGTLAGEDADGEADTDADIYAYAVESQTPTTPTPIQSQTHTHTYTPSSSRDVTPNRGTTTTPTTRRRNRFSNWFYFVFNKKRESTLA